MSDADFGLIGVLLSSGLIGVLLGSIVTLVAELFSPIKSMA